MIVIDYHKFVIVFPLKNFEAILTCLEGNTIEISRACHHLAATHEVVHTVFKSREQSFFINEVKIDYFVCGDLYSLVAFDIVNKPPLVQLMVL